MSERLSAVDAHAMGRVHRIAAMAELLSVALPVAQVICTASPMSIRASKNMVLRSLGADFEASFGI